MALIKTKSLTIKVKYLVNNHGLPYYQRSVPKHLQARLGRQLIKVRLKNATIASQATVINKLTARYDALFKAMTEDPSLVPSDIKIAALTMLDLYGLSQGDGTGPWADELVDSIIDRARDDKATPVELMALEALKSPLPDLLSEIPEIYFTNHRNRQNKKFRERCQYVFGKLIEITGDIGALSVQRQDVYKYRDERLKTGIKTQTVRRELNVLHAAYEAYLREKNIDRRNPFDAISILGEGKDAEKKSVFTQQQLVMLLKESMRTADDIRNMVILLACTGARVSEIAGLRKQDISLHDDIPYLHIQEYAERTTKTRNSIRMVPLVSPAFEAAKKQMNSLESSEVLFPRYCDGIVVKAESASATINKWLKAMLNGEKYTTHCFRHTIRDLLRHCDTPAAIINEIGGWARQEIGDSYGHGYALKQKQEALQKALGAVIRELSKEG